MTGSRFDLLSEGVIPVRWRPGKLPEGRNADDPVSLRELFLHAHNIVDVQVSLPPAASGLLRVLYVLAARISGLDKAKEFDEWSDRREDILRAGSFTAKQVDKYFGLHSDRFGLFDEARPFLQERRLVEQCHNTKGEHVSSGVNKLVLGRAAGQSFVWQSHTNDAVAPPVPAAEAFFALLAWLFYGPGGRCTSRQVPGQDKPVADTRTSPLRGTVSYHPLGETLFETLLIGLPFLPSDDGDLAPWEEEAEPDPLRLPPIPRGIGRVLTGRARHALLLTPDADGRAAVDARITWAWREEHPPVRDPFLIYQSSKDDPGSLFPAAADAHRAIWRDLDALAGHNSASSNRHRPLVFKDVDALADDDSPVDVEHVRVRAFGFDQDRSQAKDRQYFTGTTPPVLRLLTDKQYERANRLETAVYAAEGTGRTLRAALSTAWAALIRTKPDAKRRSQGVPWLHSGMARYWSLAEQRFWDIVLPADPPPGFIRNTFIRLALQAYSEVTDRYTRAPKEIEAIETARKNILQGWKSEKEDPSGQGSSSRNVLSRNS